jgi:hypothetical protein
MTDLTNKTSISTQFERSSCPQQLYYGVAWLYNASLHQKYSKFVMATPADSLIQNTSHGLVTNPIHPLPTFPILVKRQLN